MISISNAAVQEIRRLQFTRQKTDSHLRLQVRAGGCLGLYYTLEFDEVTDEADSRYDSNGIIVTVDVQSQKYLETLMIDYSEDLMGGGFIFQNPNVSSTCSCGNSFAVDTV